MTAQDTILWTCPSCQASLSVPVALAGKRVRCPHCQTVGDVPPLAQAVPVVPPLSAPGQSLRADLRALWQELPRPVGCWAAGCHSLRLMVWIGCLIDVGLLAPRYSQAWLTAPGAAQQSAIASDATFAVASAFLIAFALDRILSLLALGQLVRWQAPRPK